MQRNTTRQLTPVLGNQQPAIGRSIVSGKAGEFLLEALKAQAEAERFSVLEKKLTRLRDLGRRFCLPAV